MPHVEQEMLTLLEHLSPTPVLVGFVLFDVLFSVYCFVYYCLFFFLMANTINFNFSYW